MAYVALMLRPGEHHGPSNAVLSLAGSHSDCAHGEVEGILREEVKEALEAGGKVGEDNTTLALEAMR